MSHTLHRNPSKQVLTIAQRQKAWRERHKAYNMAARHVAEQLYVLLSRNPHKAEAIRAGLNTVLNALRLEQVEALRESVRSRGPQGRS